MFSVRQEVFSKRSQVVDKVILCNNLEDMKINKEILNLIPREICIKYNLIPIDVNYSLKTIKILTSYPIMGLTGEDIKFITGYDVVFLHYKDTKILESFIAESLKDINPFKDQGEDNGSDLGSLEDESDSPAVKIVNYIIREALNLKASDIHIEPFKLYYKVRYRVDGYLREGIRLSKTSFNSVISRIKVMSKIDISEKRLPLDGRISIDSEGILWDLRVSTMPTINGEKLVIRIFQESAKIEGLNDIGLINENISIIESFLSLKSGIVLISGPTGSGKSTTLYTMLRQLDINKRNIVTIEDPVEQRVEGITQINVNSQIGFDFASSLRSVLRQDPDIIMIGEIRDSDTASIAMRAAITGHLVFSTIHTQDSVSVVDRLLDMGIEPYLITSGLSGVISQRLVRRICTNCSIDYEPNEYEMNILSISKDTPLKKGSGCEKCGNTGYVGRIGVFETLKIGSSYRNFLEVKIRNGAINENYIGEDLITLKESCISILKKGITTTNEILNLI